MALEKASEVSCIPRAGGVSHSRAYGSGTARAIFARFFSNLPRLAQRSFLKAAQG